MRTRECKVHEGIKWFVCNGCRKWKKVDDFAKDNRNTKTGIRGQCKECDKLYRDNRKAIKHEESKPTLWEFVKRLFK